ncbi:MAG: aldo/keto reductase [Oscillospiraceae bacterium]|nr:aldo/keto reductase [Oscillospiraceae bacterium]
MIYRNFQDIKLSNLGMGTMRLPIIEGKFDEIDEKATAEMVEYALKNGVNYFDTAWGYHDGMSEIAVGKALSKYPRESFYLATKFPGYDLSNMDKVEEIFEKQLEKCGVEYFDFYLFHNVCEMNIDAYLDPKYGIDKFLTEQKKNGRIRHLGFSVHGCYDVMKRFLDAYGDHMEFCQVQLNWLDWDFQDAKLKVELLNKLDIPVWVMEPLRGGKLANLAEEHENELKKLRPDEEIPAWSFRYLQGIKGVTVILSGMSNIEQVQKNIETFKTDKPLNDKENAALADIAKKMLNSSLPCTACRYCTSHCPQGLDIPKLIEIYNEHSFTGGGFIAPMLIGTLPDDKKPSACVGCRSCEAVCPQQIKISEAMKDFTERLKA